MPKLLFAVLLFSWQLAAAPLTPFFSPFTTITATATDPSNNLYIAGTTSLTNLPITSGVVPSCSNPQCEYAFAAKLSSSGTVVVAIYYGPSGYLISALALDANQNVFLAENDGSISELSADGTKVLARTMLAGAQASAIAVASSGDVFAVGWTTTSGQFVATPGAFQTVAQGSTDAVVLHMDAALSRTIYATFLGGAGTDIAYGLAIDASGDAYVTGTTSDMRSFPMTPGAVLQYSSAQDVFVAEVNPSGSGLIFSALFGANYVSTGLALAVDASGVYVAGVTSGPDFPVPKGAFLTSGNAFAAKLSPDGSALLYQTFLPGPSNAALKPFEMSVDTSGNLLVFAVADVLVPTTVDSFAPCTSSRLANRYVLQLNPSGTARTYGSYLPGGIAIRADGQAWYADTTSALHSFNIHDALPPGPRCVADILTYLEGPVAPGSLVVLFGPHIGPDEPVNLQLDSSGKVGVYLGGLSVYFNGIAAPLLYVAPNQINAVVPFEIAGAPESTLVILKDGVELQGPTMPAVAAAPALVSNPDGCAAAINPDGSINSSSHPASLGSVVSVFGEGAGLMNPSVTGGIGHGNSTITAHVSAELTEPGFPSLGGPTIAPVSVLYAGDAPGDVTGVFQLNLKMPDSFVTGMLNFSVGMGDATAYSCLWVGPKN